MIVLEINLVQLSPVDFQIDDIFHEGSQSGCYPRVSGAAQQITPIKETAVLQ